MQRLFSFDVFDTLITRTTATPRGIFVIMQDYIQNSDLPDFIKQQFFTIRTSTPDFLRVKEKIKEITFEQIYEFISKNYALDIEQKNYLKNLEEEIEIKNSVAIIQNIEKVKNLIKSGEKVVLISDMYLSEIIIRKILCGHDSYFENIPIYVSCDYEKTKTSGDIFKIVKERENVEYKNWIHFGDNKVGDVKSPKKLGIKAKFFEFYKLKNYEKKLLVDETSYLQLSIGSARNLRLLQNCNEKKGLGISFGGALLFPYVYWVLKTASEQKIKHLYFVHRDGYIMKQIAQEIASQNFDSINSNIKISYIYGSKIAWKDNITDLTIEYLKQEVDFNENFAFVDICGSGNTHLALNNLLEKHNLKQVKIFYYGTGDLLYKKGLVRAFFPYMPSYELEPLLRCLEGSCIGYFCDKNGKYVPILSDKENLLFEKWDYKSYIDGVVLFVREFCKVLEFNRVNVDYFQSRELLQYYVKTPDKELANLIGSIPFEVSGFKEFAPKISFWQIFKLRKLENRWSFWLRVERSNIFIRLFFKNIRRVKNYLKGGI